MNRLYALRARLYRAYHVFRGRPMIYGITFTRNADAGIWAQAGVPGTFWIDTITVDHGGADISTPGVTFVADRAAKSATSTGITVR